MPLAKQYLDSPVWVYPSGLIQLRGIRTWNKEPHKGTKCDNGYHKVVLRKSKFHRYVHVMVAELFLEPKPENCEVDHIDRDRSNNDMTNLRWLSHAENMLNNKRRVANLSRGRSG